MQNRPRAFMPIPLPVQSLLAYINHRMSKMHAWSLQLHGQVPG